MRMFSLNLGISNEFAAFLVNILNRCCVFLQLRILGDQLVELRLQIFRAKFLGTPKTVDCVLNAVQPQNFLVVLRTVNHLRLLRLLSDAQTLRYLRANIIPAHSDFLHFILQTIHIRMTKNKIDFVKNK